MKNQIEPLLEIRDLGFNKKTGRLGVLFPNRLVDFRLVAKNEDGTTPDIRIR